MRSMNVKELLEQPTVSLIEAGEMLGLCRGSTYTAAAKGQIKTIRLGRLMRVPSAWLKVQLGLSEGAAS
jgi:hypothetical protein